MILVLGALVIGLCLGLLGSGGSILTLPTLVLLLGHDEKTAVMESLAIVGTISLFGSIPHAAHKNIDWQGVLLFGLPGMLGATLGAGAASQFAARDQLLVFAALMIVAAQQMYGRSRGVTAGASKKRHPLIISSAGLLVGLMTAFLGVGGGILILPGLVFLAGLEMRRAIGTTLPIIAMNAWTGFFGHMWMPGHVRLEPDTQVIFSFGAAGILGAVAGAFLSVRSTNTGLMRAFAVFLVVLTPIMVIHALKA